MDRRSLLGDVDGDDHEGLSHVCQDHINRQNSKLLMIKCALVVSLAMNCVFGGVFSIEQTQASRVTSPYAKLRKVLEEPFVKETLYTSSNETLQAEMWHNINIDAGMVALPDSWAASHELRRAQRFPWDHSKGIYLLHGYHNLHCVKIIYNSLREFRTAQPQSRNWHHVVHCLDGLRRQIICDADDTPRATERRAEVVTGVGQHRKCRSWHALETFARKHTACYKRPEHPEDGVPIIERFKHCPVGTDYVIDDIYIPIDEFVEGLPKESQLDSL